MIESPLDGVGQNRHFRPQTLQQRSFRPETSNLDIESGRIQAIGDVNELLLRTTDIEVIQEFQNSDAIRICAHDAVTLVCISCAI